MTDNDKQAFAAIMATIGVAFGSEPSKQLMAIYFEALRPCSIESIGWAATEAIRKLKWFPKAAELSEFAAIAPRKSSTPLAGKEEVKQLERLTPPGEAREKLKELAARLNGSFDSTFAVAEVNGRPTMVSEKERTK